MISPWLAAKVFGAVDGRRALVICVASEELPL
jgi:hypothetical protein